MEAKGKERRKKLPDGTQEEFFLFFKVALKTGMENFVTWFGFPNRKRIFESSHALPSAPARTQTLTLSSILQRMKAIGMLKSNVRIKNV